MYKLIGSLPTRAFRVLWMLEELGLEYELDQARAHSDTVLAVNPSGKIPVLLSDGEAIIDSVAICQYLADKHGRFTFPAGSLRRARQDSWTQFAVDDIESTLWYNAKHSFVLPEELRSETARAACRHDFDRALAVLEKRLGDKTYVMGDDFTVPDILLGHCAGWARSRSPGAEWEIPPGPVADYFERVRSRPACVKALEIRKNS